MLDGLVVLAVEVVEAGAGEGAQDGLGGGVGGGQALAVPACRANRPPLMSLVCRLPPRRPGALVGGSGGASTWVERPEAVSRCWAGSR
ncbi:hypothetical protein GCM10010495_65460 [Kitasatospora herbaricolor]|nr:hypothetical protein GCM10010495_65460 [Kitasatospora herbaricolor]